MSNKIHNIKGSVFNIQFLHTFIIVRIGDINSQGRIWIVVTQVTYIILVLVFLSKFLKMSIILEACQYYFPWAHEVWRQTIEWFNHSEFCVRRINRVKLNQVTLNDEKIVCLMSHMWIQFIQCKFSHIYIYYFDCIKTTIGI